MRSQSCLTVSLRAILWVGMVFATWSLSAAETDVKQLMVKYRKTVFDAPRRVAAVRELVAAGTEGVNAIKETLEKDLAKLEASVPSPPKLDGLDEKVAALRKKLAELRADANLTKDRLESEGIPALDQLTLLWQQREMISSQHYQRLNKTAALVARQRIFFDKLLEDWRGEAGGGPLPVADWQSRVEKLEQKVAPPLDPVVRQVAEENIKLAPQLDRDVVAGMNALNAMRVMCGLRPLVYDTKLCLAATGHSSDMQNHGFFAHESPLKDKKTPFDRAKLAGTTASGENIYMGSSVTVDALRAWFLSPGHHKNMFGEGHKRQGLGRVGKYWTQMFGA